MSTIFWNRDARAVLFVLATLLLPPLAMADPASQPPAKQTDSAPSTPAPAREPKSGVVGASYDQPRARTDANSQTAHRQLVEKTKKGHIEVYFVGDSITRRWGATDYPEFLAHWNK